MPLCNRARFIGVVHWRCIGEVHWRGVLESLIGKLEWQAKLFIHHLSVCDRPSVGGRHLPGYLKAMLFWVAKAICIQRPAETIRIARQNLKFGLPGKLFGAFAASELSGQTLHSLRESFVTISEAKNAFWQQRFLRRLSLWCPAFSSPAPIFSSDNLLHRLSPPAVVKFSPKCVRKSLNSFSHASWIFGLWIKKLLKFMKFIKFIKFSEICLWKIF